MVRLLTTALAFTLAAGFVCGASGDPPQTLLDVFVLDRVTEKPIEGLQAADFEVLENGVPQKLSDYSSQAPALEIVLLLEAGAGMLLPVDEAREALDVLRSDDRVALMTLSGRGRLRLPFTNDWDAVAKELDRISRRGGAGGHATLSPPFVRRPAGPRICDALLKAVRLFPGSADCDHRRAILIVTHDRRAPSDVGEREVVQKMLAAQVTLSGAVPVPHLPRSLPPVVTRPPQLPRPSLPPEPCCQAAPIAPATGGDLLKYELSGRRRQTGSALLGQLLGRIRTRYRLSYTPAPLGTELPELEVRLTGVAKLTFRDAEVRWRANYCH
jgi:hypothetical protein